jgi:hypothetical protein
VSAMKKANTIQYSPRISLIPYMRDWSVWTAIQIKIRSHTRRTLILLLLARDVEAATKRPKSNMDTMAG